jgi:hypothetical protein
MADSGTVTISEERLGSVKKITFAWTSTAGGAASKTTSYAYNGEIIRQVTVPGAGGSAPTDQYDITVTDGDSTDVLMGQGANRSNVNTEQVLASSLGCVANDTLTLNVSNAGNAKSGTLYVYIR